MQGAEAVKLPIHSGWQKHFVLSTRRRSISGAALQIIP